MIYYQINGSCGDVSNINAAITQFNADFPGLIQWTNGTGSGTYVEINLNPSDNSGTCEAYSVGYPTIQDNRITIQDVETETLIYDERTHKAWRLNRSSACIWRLCNGSNTVRQIADAAAADLAAPVTEDLVLLTLDELLEKALLEPDSFALPPHTISRRQMMGRAGLTAAALLPVIAALTAPPASAQSG